MDSIQAQLQIRQNALEAQDYVQDLMSWQQNLKSSQTKAGSSKQQHPQLPVRGRAAGSVAAAPKEAQQPRSLQPPTSSQQQQNKESHPAAHTYKNYDKWDKFDVDAALQAADTASSSKAAQPRPAAVPTSRDQQQQQQPPMMEPRVANAPAAAQSPTSKAAALKDQGNKLFQARYYEDAISCYTQSIDALPTAVAYANRAMALLKLEKYTEAAADCSAALQVRTFGQGYCMWVRLAIHVAAVAMKLKKPLPTVDCGHFGREEGWKGNACVS
jgi:tetratricopeptide (TPR) repeat protein